MSHIIKSLSTILNLHPNVDYFSYMPTKPASSQAWELVGNNLAKTIIIQALEINLPEEEKERLNVIIDEIDQITTDKYTDAIHPAVIDNENKQREQKRRNSRTKQPTYPT